MMTTWQGQYQSIVLCEGWNLEDIFTYVSLNAEK